MAPRRHQHGHEEPVLEKANGFLGVYILYAMLYTIEASFIKRDHPLEYTVILLEANLHSWGTFD